MRPAEPVPKDLVILVADSQQERTVVTLLDERQESLGIRPVQYDRFPHPHRDPGVYREAGNYLAVFTRQYRHALVFLDAEWEGSPGSAEQIAEKVQGDLDRQGWKDRSAVIVLDPELEIWVWIDSPHVPMTLDSTWPQIRDLAERRGYWPSGVAKPTHPKALLDELLRQAHKPPSAALFAHLARQVGLRRCQDPAFVRFREVLSGWFPAAQG